MKYLLDTHVWLWLQTQRNRINPEVVEQLADPDNDLLLSAASSWEIAIKYALGRLPLPMPPNEYVPSRMTLTGTTGLPVEHRHALLVADLPGHHRDPFDRLLIAQAQLEDAVLVSADAQFDAYDVPVLWT